MHEVHVTRYHVAEQRFGVLRKEFMERFRVGVTHDVDTLIVDVVFVLISDDSEILARNNVESQISHASKTYNFKCSSMESTIKYTTV